MGEIARYPGSGMRELKDGVTGAPENDTSEKNRGRTPPGD
jgi:hypothetical protein